MPNLLIIFTHTVQDNRTPLRQRGFPVFAQGLSAMLRDHPCSVVVSCIHPSPAGRRVESDGECSDPTLVPLRGTVRHA